MFAFYRSLITDSEEITGGLKDTNIQYDNISQTGSVQSIMSSDIDNEEFNENKNDTINQSESQAPETKSKVKLQKFNDHLKSQDFQVCVTIIEARQLPGE
jgi:hypothetical protein